MMSHVRAALVRVRELLRRRAESRTEQDEEFSFHIDMETAENVRRGMNPGEARRAALVRFGGTERFREETTDARRIVTLDHLIRDTRFAIRRLRRAPGFSIGVIATLGIGIGAAVGIGSIVYGVLVRDLPYPEPKQLVRVGLITNTAATTGDLHPPATYFHFAKSARSFSDIGAYFTSDLFSVTDGDAPERVAVAMMTPNLFTLLGVRPILGDLFETRDTSWTEGRSRGAILISEDFWRRRYGADPSIIGRRIDINRGERVIIGVLPRSFAFPTPSIDLYYPSTIPVNRPQIALGYLTVIGRLRVGVTPTAAEAELNALIPSLSDRFPVITHAVLERSRPRVSVVALKAASVAAVRPQLVLLGVLVAIVLLIATTNVANLFLLRAERASQEIAIALSLGASRGVLAMRFLVEGVALGLLAAFVALPAVAVSVSTKFGFTEREIPRLHEITLTTGTIVLVFSCALFIGAAIGLIALSRTRMTGLFDRLRSVRSTSSIGWRRTQSGLVAFQVAIALTLLIAAGLLGRSFWNLRNAKIGFDPAGASTFQISLPWNGYTSYADDAAFHANLADRLAALPGVTSVGVTTRVPLTSQDEPVRESQLQVDDGDASPKIAAAGNMASADYFRAMGIPILRGRSFQSGDLRGAPGIVVSERLATSLLGTTDVVGRRIMGRIYEGMALRAFTIVGVVGDVQWGRIEDGFVPTVYFPILRDGDGFPADSNPIRRRPTEVQFVIRGTQLPATVAIQKIVTELDHRVPAANVRALDSIVSDATARVRLTLLLIATAGVAALMLGVIGVYSVVSYAANGRMREFGIRIALGAAPTRVGRMVLADGLRLVGSGIVLGLTAAVAATRFLGSLLYEVKPTSVSEFGMATALLVGVSLLATLLPARRAAQTHPATVLRGD